MKRCTIIILLISLLAALCSCSSQGSSTTDFYYLTAAVQYDSEDGVITAEKRSKNESDALVLLTEYLKGPASKQLISPFPDGCRLLSCDQNENVLQITVSNEFATLTGYDLTLACACLTLTARSVFPVTTVEIRAESELLDGKSVITMNPEDLLLIDSSNSDS